MADMKKYRQYDVWLWKDPIYDYKTTGCKVDDLEIGLRYSRPVIIIQSNKFLTNPNAIQVIPIGSNNSSPHDVSFTMNEEKKSYAKCQFINPVHPETLIQWKGFLPENIILQIKQKIKELTSDEDEDIISKNEVSRDSIDNIKSSIIEKITPVPSINKQKISNGRVGGYKEPLIKFNDKEARDFLELYEVVKSQTKMLEYYPALKTGHNVTNYIVRYKKKLGLAN